MEQNCNKKTYEREDIKVRWLSEFDATMERFENIWGEYGISEDRTWNRANVVVEHTKSLLGELLKEETGLYSELKGRISKCLEEVKAICLDLNLEVEEPAMDMPLLQKEQMLIRKLDALKREKHARLEEFEQLGEKESVLCDLLALPTSAPTYYIPTRQELQELQKRIDVLTEERDRRYKMFCLAKCELTTIMEESEFSPETPFEQKVVHCEENDTFVLSNENLQQITLMLSKFKDRKLRMEENIKALLEKLHALWERLNIDEDVREAFLKEFSDCRQSTLSAVKHEIKCCEEIKKQNLKAHVKKLRSELTDLWEKCYISEKERKKFAAYHATDFTEELLDLHDKELQKMKTYCEQTEIILQKIEMRKDLWELMLRFEEKAADPNRFHNRGGNLLREERERKKILKDLRKLEREISKAINQYERTHDQLFLLNGVRFADHIAFQWAEHEKRKENEKLHRQKQRYLQNAPPKTISNKPLFSSPTPSRTPLAHFGFSAVRPLPRIRKAPIPYTPSDYANKQTRTKNLPQRITETPSKPLATRNAATPPSKPLATRNAATPPSKPIAAGNAATTENSDITASYSQFAAQLEKYDKEYLCSSAMNSKKKVLGSKISHSGVLRKSHDQNNPSFVISSKYFLRSTRDVNQK